MIAKKGKEGTLRRVHDSFINELEEIKEARKEEGMPEKISDKELTRMIPKHNFWKNIKKDLIKYKFNKRGLVTMDIFIFIFMVFIWIIILGIYLTIFNLTTDNLNRDIDIGQVNLAEIVESTFGSINSSFINTADIIGIVIIFGLMINMFFNAYMFRGKYPKVFIIIDIVLLVFAYIVAVYVSNTYETLINSSSILNVYINDISKASRFILNLPIYVSIIGLIMMVLSYAGFPRDTQREVLLGELG